MTGSTPTIEEELDALADFLGAHREGLARQEIGAAFRTPSGESLSPRTLLRRLNRLIEEGRVKRDGPSNAPIYRAVSSQQSPQRVTQGEPAPIQLSSIANELRESVGRPIVERQPVGYQRQLLTSYIPGETWYLDNKTRAGLHELGRTPDPERPAGTFAREIYENLLIDLSWASSRLEGNTYSRLDTASLLKFGHRAEGKDAIEAQMVLNHKRAIDFLIEDAADLAFDRRTMLTLHAMLAENLVGDPGDEGRLRRRMVQITGTTYTPVAIPQIIAECFDEILAKLRVIPDPFEQSLFAMVHLPYLQPFVDVNKRTSRLAANIPLIQGNLTPLSFIDVPRDLYLQATLAVYETCQTELLRDVFLWAYKRSCAQYRVVRDALVQPNPLRLRYRAELEDLIRHFVLQQILPDPEPLLAWVASARVPTEDRQELVEVARELLIELNEGTAGRYRLSTEELLNWRRQLQRNSSQ